MTAPQGYAEAMSELEQILAEIEREDVDVDVLSAKVKRASELIAFCRRRIEQTRLEVEEIMSDLEPPSPTAGSVDDPEGETT